MKHTVVQEQYLNDIDLNVTSQGEDNVDEFVTELRVLASSCEF